jgi:hypothetical protein
MVLVCPGRERHTGPGELIRLANMEVNMSDDYSPFQESDAADGFEYEEIEEEVSSEEVDRVLEALSAVMEDLESEAVYEQLEAAYNKIFSLVYEEEEAAAEEEDDFDAEEEDEYEADEYEEDEYEEDDDEVDFDDDREAEAA